MKSKSLNPVSTKVMVFLALAIGVLLCSPSAFAKNLIYIDGNVTTTGANVVIALANDGAGNLTPVAGSPFATGGTGVAGTGDPLADTQWDSDGELAINRDGTLLFAVNGHSNDFSAFNLNADGSLTLIPGSPFPSGGTQPASIGFKDNASGNGISMMVIANKDSDPFQVETAPNYTTFRIGADGVPLGNPGSTFPLAAGSSPAHIMVPKRGNDLFGSLYLGKNISTYRLSRTGVMTTVSSLHVNGDPVGGVLHPNAQVLYLTVPSKDKLTVLSYDNAYNLKLEKEILSPGNATCWAETNKGGTRLYTTETLSGSVTVYDITNPTGPVQLQHLVLSGDQPFTTHTRMDPSGKFLYVLDRQGVLHVLDVAGDGTVSENRAPFDLGLPTGTVPLGVAVLRK